jgi:putative tryptophan/tyrosine transport system substrate-binding protein
MRRREFIVALGSTMLRPVVVLAQQATMPLIGVLGNGSAAESEPKITALKGRLSELGYFDGKNVLIEYRWAEGHNDRLLDLADSLVQQRVALILTVGGSTRARGKSSN